MWRDLIAEGVVIGGLGFLLLCGIAIVMQPGDDFSCAAADYEGRDEGVLADDAHDRWIDEQEEAR